ncbi:MAG: ribosomal-protein-alanine N-acetyltransferase, partial [Candidatus Puniceispirillaceae bacterium]
LLEQGLHLATKHGVSRVLLEVKATNKSAYKLYRSSGFELVGKRPNYYRRRAKISDALVLKCNLS